MHPDRRPTSMYLGQGGGSVEASEATWIAGMKLPCDGTRARSGTIGAMVCHRCVSRPAKYGFNLIGVGCRSRRLRPNRF